MRLGFVSAPLSVVCERVGTCTYIGVVSVSFKGVMLGDHSRHSLATSYIDILIRRQSRSSCNIVLFVSGQSQSTSIEKAAEDMRSVGPESPETLHTEGRREKARAASGMRMAPSHCGSPFLDPIDLVLIVRPRNLMDVLLALVSFYCRYTRDWGVTQTRVCS